MAERENPETTRAGHWGAVAAGGMAALTVAWWSRPALFPGSSPGRAVAVGALWLLATVGAGTLGMALAGGFAQARSRPGRVRAGLNAAAVWVLIPPLLLLLVEASPWLLAAVAAMAVGLAACLWAVAPPVPAEEDEAGMVQEGPVFAELPPSRSGPKLSAAIAVCLEAAFVFLVRGEAFWSGIWLALGSLLLGWKALAARSRPERRAADPRARLGGAAAAALAVVVVLLTLHLAQVRPGPGGSAAASAHAQEKQAGMAADDAYRGIVLFTVPEKKKELPPLPMERALLHAGTNRPVVIPFDGSYWYFQAPQHGPGLHPHLAHGDPVAMNIYSTGWIPLAMQAHQTLTQAIPVSGGERFELTLRNGDNRAGRIDVAVLLTDSHAPGIPEVDRPAVMLGVQPMRTTEPPAFAYKSSPVEEDLTYTIPAPPALRQFDTITVLFFPSAVRDTMGARVGIQQFTLLPR